MYILVNINATQAKIYDSTDDSTDIVSVTALKRRMNGTKKIRVYGLKLWKKGAFYPPTAQVLPELGIVVLPDEKAVAMEKVKQQKKEAELTGKRRKGVITVTLKNLHKCYYDAKHSLYVNGELMDNWSEEEVRQALLAGNHITMQ